MSLPKPGGPRPPLRVLGVGLVALAVGMIGVGVVTVGSSSTESTAAETPTTTPTAMTTTAPVTSTPTPTPTSPRATPTTTPPPLPSATLTSRAAAPVTTPPQPAPLAAPSQATARPQPPVIPSAATPSRVPVRVFNNSTITGLGEKAAGELRADGWQVVEVGNFQGLFSTTTVYYRPGAGEQAAAEQLASSIGATAAPRIEEIASQAPGLILVVTSDFTG